MAKIRLLDILQKDHGTGPISLVQEMERSAGRGKIRLLDQIRRRGKDNEVLARYHVPELKENYKQLGIMYTEADFNRYLAEQELAETEEKLERTKFKHNLKLDRALDLGIEEGKIKGERKGFKRGVRAGLENTVMHKLESDIIPELKEGIFYAPDSMEDMRQMVKAHPSLHRYGNNTGNMGVIVGMGQDTPQNFGAFKENIEKSLEESREHSYMCGNSFPLIGRTKDYVYPTHAYITKPTSISEMIRHHLKLDPEKVLPSSKYKYK